MRSWICSQRTFCSVAHIYSKCFISVNDSHEALTLQHSSVLFFSTIQINIYVYIGNTWWLVIHIHWQWSHKEITLQNVQLLLPVGLYILYTEVKNLYSMYHVHSDLETYVSPYRITGKPVSLDLDSSFLNLETHIWNLTFKLLTGLKIFRAMLVKQNKPNQNKTPLYKMWQHC